MPFSELVERRTLKSSQVVVFDRALCFVFNVSLGQINEVNKLCGQEMVGISVMTVFVCFFYLNSFRAQAILPSQQRKNLRFLLRTNNIIMREGNIKKNHKMRIPKYRIQWVCVHVSSAEHIGITCSNVYNEGVGWVCVCGGGLLCAHCF